MEIDFRRSDCAYKNIMLDAEPLYPKGFHPITSVSLPDDVTVSAPVLSRKNVPVKYYYIDFGISTRFKPGKPHKLVTGTDGIEQLVPELSNNVPYDPFKVDVFVLGRMLYETFFQKYANVDMIVPMVYDMVDPDPAKRPSAEDVLRQFQEMRRGVSALQASWRLRPRDEPLVVTAVLETVSLLTAAFKCVF
ncbi:hypothetical protein BN946_scf185043.g216 [Trametes cinnabarina]|uniref:Protein kinase domain-containing protein n=1 Tax=Pycnoporus cinnabarinus TaxID=5643 RepID=A0A060SID1_PYCCI|nr:hypothetical protein BN946_scf185043.g216 [Trametes cinnabarina]